MIWWVSRPELLSDEARQRIVDASEDTGLFVSSISCWEISLLVRKGRLELNMAADEWISSCEAIPAFQFVPVDNRIAVRSNALIGEFHDDPADRLIVATTLVLSATLITKDRKIRSYSGVETLW